MPTNDMVQLNIRTSPEQRAIVDRMVEELNTTASYLVREGLAHMAEKFGYTWVDNVRKRSNAPEPDQNKIDS